MEPAAAEQYFWSIALCKRDTFKLFPLQYKPDYYLLIVTVNAQSNNNKAKICKMTCGEDIPSIFKNKNAKISLGEPLYLLARTWQWSQTES
jgi:hypothetical protein